MIIENPTLAHFRHFSSLFTNLPSTSVENSLQIDPFMQNKANFRKSQMNVNPYNTKDYEDKRDWTPGENKPNSKPICQRVKLMQSVYLQRTMKKNADRGYEKTKPIQTQSNPISRKAKIDAKSVFTKDYEEKCGYGL